MSKRRSSCNATQLKRTFGELGELWVRGQAHVLLGREAVTVEGLGPSMALAGQHWSAAVPHCCAQATARQDEPGETEQRQG